MPRTRAGKGAMKYDKNADRMPQLRPEDMVTREEAEKPRSRSRSPGDDEDPKSTPKAKQAATIGSSTAPPPAADALNASPQESATGAHCSEAAANQQSLG